MTIADLGTYFTAASAVAGSLIGLLFVAITVRYEAILGSGAPSRNEAVARSAFTALVNALSLSLLALLPHAEMGVPAVILGGLCIVLTVRTHFARQGWRSAARLLFAMSLSVYIWQTVVGALLIAWPGRPDLVTDLAYIVFSALIAGLARSWELLQKDRAPATAAGAHLDEPAATVAGTTGAPRRS